VFIPEFVLGVNFVVGSSVRSGSLAERVGTEGVMLQYAVDTHLDEALAAVWMQVGGAGGGRGTWRELCCPGWSQHMEPAW
jgi:hypothetical protein